MEYFNADNSHNVDMIRHELSTFVENTHVEDIQFGNNITVNIALHDCDLGVDVHFFVQRDLQTVIEIYFYIRVDSVALQKDIDMMKLTIASLITSVRISNA